MKNIFIIAFLLVTFLAFSQQKRTEKLNTKTNLVEVACYYDNGNLSQNGTYTKDGLLHGVWVSYSINGHKTAIANYDQGKKVGKWFFWDKETLTEVDYDNNVIASVNVSNANRKLRETLSYK